MLPPGPGRCRGAADGLRGRPVMRGPPLAGGCSAGGALAATGVGRHVVTEQVLEALPALLDAGPAAAPRSATASRTMSYGASSVTASRTVRPSATACSPRADRAAASGASPSSTSTARTPVRSVNAPSGAARRSRPASMATRKSQTRSISPRRWLATMTAIPNSVPVRRTSAEHLVAAGRVEAVGRLVEQQQPRVVDERLGELDPLLHAGRVAADRAVALLVQPDVAQHLGRPLAGRRARAARTSGPCG